MLLTMPVVMLKVVALIFQRIERLIFDLPPRSTTAHELIDVTRAYPQVCHPTKVLLLVLANLPILDEIDPYVRSRCIERHVVHKAKLMHNPSGAVVPLIIGNAPSFFGRLHLVEQIGMIPLFDPEDIVTSIVMQGFDVGSIGTQGVFGDDELEMRVILAQLGDEAFGSVAFAIVFL